MNNSGNLARAIRGPILLITIGSLIAFDTFDGYSFTRTWPVIISDGSQSAPGDRFANPHPLL